MHENFHNNFLFMIVENNQNIINRKISTLILVYLKMEHYSAIKNKEYRNKEA